MRPSNPGNEGCISRPHSKDPSKWDSTLTLSLSSEKRCHSKCIGLHFVLCSTTKSEKCSHSECIGLHFVLCRTKKVGQSCYGTRFNRLTFVRMSTKSRDTGLGVHAWWAQKLHRTHFTHTSLDLEFRKVSNANHTKSSIFFLL